MSKLLFIYRISAAHLHFFREQVCGILCQGRLWAVNLSGRAGIGQLSRDDYENGYRLDHRICPDGGH